MVQRSQNRKVFHVWNKGGGGGHGGGGEIGGKDEGLSLGSKIFSDHFYDIPSDKRTNDVLCDAL